MRPRFLLPTLALLCTAATARAQCTALWGNAWTNTVVGYSHVTPAGQVVEIADDFELAGAVVRLRAEGNGPFCCGTSALAGAYVRFYEWTPAGPGALQREHFLAEGDPAFQHEDIPLGLALELPTPFLASGRHFVSVQVVFSGNGYWQWWGANQGSPVLTTPWVRDGAGAWAPATSFFGESLNLDASFSLYGYVDGTSEPTCEEWLEIPSPNHGNEFHLLRGIHARAADDVWAVGNYTTPYPQQRQHSLAMHFDGATWTIVPTPNPEPYANGENVGLDCVAALAPDDAWAAGHQLIAHPVDNFVGTQILVMHWDGSAWSVVPAPVTPAGSSGAVVRDVVALAADDVWFVGDWVQSGGGPSQPALALHWDGFGFTRFETPYFSGAGHGFEAVSAVSTDDVWAVGGGGDGDWVGFGYVAHWDGTSWTRVDAPTVGLSQRLFDVEALSADDVWVSGQANTGSGVVAVLQHWDGSGWTRYDVPTGGGGVAALASDDVWVAGGGGFVHWDGSSWTHVPALGCVPGAALGDLDVVPGVAEIWAAGRRVGGTLQTLTARWRPCAEQALGVSYCYGNGNGSWCPCGNVGSPGRGCEHGSGDGVLLSARAGAGAPIELLGAGLPAAGQPTVVAIRSRVRESGGFGRPFGDGLLCVGGNVTRMAAASASQGAVVLPIGHSAGPGEFHYQLWYRNAASYCTAAAFNLSNGLTLLWP